MSIHMPAWLATVAPDSGLKRDDVLSIFNYTEQQLHRAIKSGAFPAADRMVWGLSKRPTRLWTARTIRNEIVRRNQSI